MIEFLLDLVESLFEGFVKLAYSFVSLVSLEKLLGEMGGLG